MNLLLIIQGERHRLRKAIFGALLHRTLNSLTTVRKSIGPLLPTFLVVFWREVALWGTLLKLVRDPGHSWKGFSTCDLTLQWILLLFGSLEQRGSNYLLQLNWSTKWLISGILKKYQAARTPVARPCWSGEAARNFTLFLSKLSPMRASCSQILRTSVHTTRKKEIILGVWMNYFALFYDLE